MAFMKPQQLRGAVIAPLLLLAVLLAYCSEVGAQSCSTQSDCIQSFAKPSFCKFGRCR